MTCRQRVTGCDEGNIDDTTKPHLRSQTYLLCHIRPATTAGRHESTTNKRTYTVYRIKITIKKNQLIRIATVK